MYCVANIVKTLGQLFCAARIIESCILKWHGQNHSSENGGPEYSRPERDRENLVSKRRQDLVRNLVNIWTDSTVHWWLCYGCNTKSTWYSSYSGNVPGLHILLRVELLTPFTSGLPSCYVPHSSWPSSLGNIVLLFSHFVLLSSILRLIHAPLLCSQPCTAPSSYKSEPPMYSRVSLNID